MNNDVKKEISRRTTDYISSVMKQSQKLLHELVKDKGQLISLSEYIQKLEDYSIRISSIKDLVSPERQSLVDQKAYFEIEYNTYETEEEYFEICKVKISDDEISELMQLIDKSITETEYLSNGGAKLNENAFMRLALRELIETKEKDSDEFKKIRGWMSFLYSFECAGFDHSLMGSISNGYLNKFTIFDFENHIVYQESLDRDNDNIEI